MRNQVLNFIQNNWDSCIKENHEDEGTLIGLPYSYTVPAVGFFDEMFYWDTYFTNLGLIICGRFQQAKNNVNNMMYLVKRYGFMPNGNRTYFLSRSQPPFLSLMVRDIYDREHDVSWLGDAYQALIIEYDFWNTQRNSAIGLNHYDDNTPPDKAAELANEFCGRLGFRPNCSDEQLARHYFATAESGWDLNPRWELEAYNYASIDLNSLLYLHERNMEFFSHELHLPDEKIWKLRAHNRKKKITEFMETDDGLLLDYNFVRHKKSDVFSAASMYPLFVGMASQRQAQAVVDNLYRLEAEHGVLCCEQINTPGSFQWGYPNGWACIQYVAIVGLERYGYHREAERIARKYLDLVDNVFRETHNLWEKYNVVEGNIRVTNEYGLPSMMGWSAGVYLAALQFLEGAPPILLQEQAIISN